MYNAEQYEETRDEFVNNAIECLMSNGEQCDPWSHDNIIEAITQTDSFELTKAIRDAVLESDADNRAWLVAKLEQVIEGYWEGVARHIANQKPF